MMTRIIHKAALTREKLRSILVKNHESVLPDITLIDMQLGNEEEGLIELLGADPHGRVFLIDFDCTADDHLLVRLLSQAQWLKKNERLVSRLFFSQKVDFSQIPCLVLIAPAFSPQLIAAARQILSPEIRGVSYAYLIQGQDDAILFEEVFANRRGQTAPRTRGFECPESPSIPRDVAAPFSEQRQSQNHAFPGAAALTAEEIAEFMDFDNKPV